MPRPRTGSIVRRGDKIYARITYIEDGVRKQVWRRAENVTEAKRINRHLIQDLEDRGPSSIDGERMTFKQLAEYYEEHYIVEPQYIDGQKVAGLRGHKKYLPILKPLREYFGDQRIREITSGQIEKFKIVRIKTPTRLNGRRRSIASVDKELAMLCRICEIAVSEGWLLKNPCIAVRPLAQRSKETKRQQILTPEDQKRLLALLDREAQHSTDSIKQQNRDRWLLEAVIAIAERWKVVRDYDLPREKKLDRITQLDLASSFSIVSQSDKTERMQVANRLKECGVRKMFPGARSWFDRLVEFVVDEIERGQTPEEIVSGLKARLALTPIYRVKHA